MTDHIESAIAEAKAAFDATPQTESATEALAESATEETASEKPAEQPADKPTEDTPFPKKAQNALSRRDKKIGKLEQEREFLRQELAKYQQPTPAKTDANDGAPKENDFKTYAEYLEARQDWKLEQKLSSKSQADKDSQRSAESQKWLGERESFQDAKHAELSSQHPEFNEMIEENADIIGSLHPETKLALLESDNAALVLFNLAKEGKLEALADMSPRRAALEIGRAQQSTTPKQTNAPKPLSTSRGSVAPSKPIEKWSPQDAVDWMNS